MRMKVDEPRGTGQIALSQQRKSRQAKKCLSVDRAGEALEGEVDEKSKKRRLSGSFTPQRLHSAVVQMAPQFKVLIRSAMPCL
jgi:hypothetical protein